LLESLLQVNLHCYQHELSTLSAACMHGLETYVETPLQTL